MLIQVTEMQVAFCLSSKVGFLVKLSRGVVSMEKLKRENAANFPFKLWLVFRYLMM